MERAAERGTAGDGAGHQAGRKGRAEACRPGCGACCIAPSISSPIPGMPAGKPAGMPCLHLTADHVCGIYGSPDRPAVCVSFQATRDFCGATADEALRLLAELEIQTTARHDRSERHPESEGKG